jgi:hypothetical protein
MDERDKTGVGAGAAVGGVAGGLAGAAATGAAIGGVTGPVGAAAGAVAGAVVGALTGKGLAKTADLAEEDKYWRGNYSSRPYASGASYDDYGPAYQYGARAYDKYPGRSYDDIEPELSNGWTGARGNSSLGWDNARHASRDAWQRMSDAVERAIPGDSDRDGK